MNILNNDKYLKEYIELCYQEWGNKKEIDITWYLDEKRKKIQKEDKVITILGLIDQNQMIGFISLFKYDGEECTELTPWYATNYIKKEYRKKGYSKLLNNAILQEAKELGYEKVYLKTSLVNYYEKYGAKYMKTISNGEKLYYIDLKKEKN